MGEILQVLESEIILPSNRKARKVCILLTLLRKMLEQIRLIYNDIVKRIFESNEEKKKDQTAKQIESEANPYFV